MALKKQQLSLKKWSDQKWRTSSGEPSEGKKRYLPDKAWDALSPQEKAATNKAKAEGNKEGEQFVAQPKEIAKKTAKYRKLKEGENMEDKKVIVFGAQKPEEKKVDQSGEYGFEGSMAKSQLKNILNHAQEFHDMLQDDTDLPEWVQSKLTIADDHISTITDYIKTEKQSGNLQEKIAKEAETMNEEELYVLSEELKDSWFNRTFRSKKLEAEKVKAAAAKTKDLLDNYGFLDMSKSDALIDIHRNKNESTLNRARAISRNIDFSKKIDINEAKKILSEMGTTISGINQLLNSTFKTYQAIETKFLTSVVNKPQFKVIAPDYDIAAKKKTLEGLTKSHQEILGDIADYESSVSKINDEKTNFLVNDSFDLLNSMLNTTWLMVMATIKTNVEFANWQRKIAESQPAVPQQQAQPQQVQESEELNELFGIGKKKPSKKDILAQKKELLDSYGFLDQQKADQFWETSKSRDAAIKKQANEVLGSISSEEDFKRAVPTIKSLIGASFQLMDSSLRLYLGMSSKFISGNQSKPEAAKVIEDFEGLKGLAAELKESRDNATAVANDYKKKIASTEVSGSQAELVKEAEFAIRTILSSNAIISLALFQYNITFAGLQREIDEMSSKGAGVVKESLEMYVLTEKLTRPHKGEEKQDFVSRFMTDELAKKEFPDNKQRVAVAYSQWERGGARLNEDKPAKLDDTPVSKASPEQIAELKKKVKGIESVSDEAMKKTPISKATPEQIEHLKKKVKEAGKPDEEPKGRLHEASERHPMIVKFGVEGFNKPKRTPDHKTKSHLVVAKKGDTVKLVRFGAQGAKGSPKKKDESETWKNRRLNWVKRHKAQNPGAFKDKLSPLYWANKVKW
jgi:hypothetical protein